MKYIIIHIVSFFSISVSAQSVYITDFPIHEDYDQTGVKNIFERNDGMLHVITGVNLYAFDGILYKRVLSLDSIKGKITAAQYDNVKNELWLGSSQGDIMAFELTNYGWIGAYQMTSGTMVTDFLIGDKNTLLVSTNGDGLHKIDVDNKSISPVLDNTSQFIHEIVEDGNNIVWMATDDGLVRVDLSNGNFSFSRFGRQHGLDDELVYSVICQGDRTIVGTYEKGIFEFDGSQFSSITSSWAEGRVVEIIKLIDGTYLALTENSGLIHINASYGRFEKIRSWTSDKGNLNPATIFSGNGSLVWMGSNNRSLSKFNYNIQAYLPNFEAEIQAVCDVNGSSLLLGTTKGIYLFDVYENKSQLLGASSNINVVCFEPLTSHILAGTFDNGLISVSLPDFKLSGYPEHRELERNSVIAMAKQRDTLWLATLGGVYFTTWTETISDLSIRKLRSYEQLSRNYVYDILVAKNNNVYFATDGDGLAELNSGRISYFHEPNTENIQLYSIAEASNGDIWMIESANKLCRLNSVSKELDCTFHQSRTEMSSLFTCENGPLYVARLGAIDRVSEGVDQVFTFGAEHGFEQFVPSLNGVDKSPNGVVYLAAQDRVLKINTAIDDFEQPRVFIDEVRAGRNQLDAGIKHQLRHTDNTMLFKIGGHFYSRAENIAFKYKLAGHDENWLETTGSTVVYSKLPPGEYQFSIALKGFENSKDDRASFSFKIRKPIYLEWYFIALMIGLIASFVYLIMRFREAQITKEKEMERVKAERQYEVLKNQLNPHFLFNAFNTLVSYIEEDPKIAVEVVERLSDFYRRILELKDTKLIKISEELELLDDYTFLLNKRFNDNLSVTTDIDNYNLFLPPMTLQILVENAVKHNILSNAKPLKVEIADYNQKYLIVKNKIEKKRSAEQSTGIGLQNIKNRFALLGDFVMRVEQKDGYFSILLPKIRQQEI